MPIPTVTCAICGQQVTKRASLALKPLDPARTGRACRTHDEVQKLVLAQQAEDNLKRQYKAAEFNLAVIAAASWVRVQCTFFTVTPALVMLTLQSRVPRDVFAAVEADLKQRGYFMSDEEVQNSLAMALMLAAKETA